MRNFRTYSIWTEAVDFATEIYRLTSTFPSYERYGLSDQLQRAAVSIGSNIAEGSSRESEKDFAHFLEIAIGSAFEIETQLRIALNLKYIDDQQYNDIVEKLTLTERQINTFIQKLRHRQ